jgi:hypothetical protein
MLLELFRCPTASLDVACPCSFLIAHTRTPLRLCILLVRDFHCRSRMILLKFPLIFLSAKGSDAIGNADV